MNHRSNYWSNLPKSRRLAGVATLSLLIAFVVVAFYPFKWDPRIRRNGAEVEGHTVKFGSPGVLTTRTPLGWLGRIKETNGIEVSVRVRPYSLDQTGPARILTISADTYHRNLTIGQVGADLIIRLRRSDQDLNGLPEYVVRFVFEENSWRQIDVSIRANRLEVRVDEESVISQPLHDRALSTWDTGYRLAIGNELTYSRPWFGEVSKAIVVVDHETMDYLQPNQLYRPAFLWYGRAPFDTFLEIPQSLFTVDAFFNTFCFVPLGFFASLMFRERRYFYPILFCAFASLVVECLQAGFGSRYPSFLDWTTNSLGAAIGAVLAAASADDHEEDSASAPA